MFRHPKKQKREPLGELLEMNESEAKFATNVRDNNSNAIILPFAVTDPEGGWVRLVHWGSQFVKHISDKESASSRCFLQLSGNETVLTNTKIKLSLKTFQSSF